MSVPQPGPTVTVPELRFELPGAVAVLFTDRSHGSFALPSEPDGGVRAAEVHERVAGLTGVTEVARGRQVHGAAVSRVTTPPSHDARDHHAGGVEADGQATSVRGLAVMVVTADCLPVAVAGDGVVAMLHAGWRGLAAGVLEQGVLAVRDLAGPGPLAAVIGPGAGPCCYEVGVEVHEALSVSRGGPTIDLPAVARSRLVAAGVKDIRTVGTCTICSPRFYSHRREGALAGRQAGIAWLT